MKKRAELLTRSGNTDRERGHLAAVLAMLRLLLCVLFLGTTCAQNETVAVNFTNACSGGSISNSENGEINFVFPTNLSSSLNCSLHINAPAGKLLNFTFHSFNIPCNEGNLRIRYTPLKPTLTYCDDNKPRNFVSLSESVTLYFRKYYGYGYFLVSPISLSLTWNSIDGCAKHQFRCWNGNCINSTQRCNQVRDCEDDSDEITCAQNSTSFEECGKTPDSPGFSWNPRIVGGDSSNHGSWPWHVSVSQSSYFYYSSNQNCQGSIIHKNWVLISASCVHSVCENNLRIFHSIFYLTESFNVSDVIVHPNYRPLDRLAGNDIALLGIVGGFTFSQYRRPVCLTNFGTSASFSPSAGQICVAISLEHRNYGNPTQVRLPILDSTTCLAEYNKLRTLQGVANATSLPGGQICAGILSEVAGTCDGDEGGGLVCLVGESSWFQVGVSSYRLCNNERHASFYSDVSAYSTWITESITSPSTSCDRTVTGTSGKITSPNFPLRPPQYVQCRWSINAPSNTVIVIRFTEFDLPTFSSCTGTYLAIYDGNSTSSELYLNQVHCGTVAPRPGEMSSNKLVVIYRNELKVTKGFSFDWTTEPKCNETTEFRCWDGSCKPKSQQCDGTKHCTDNSDEIECARSSTNASECGKQTVAPLFKWSPRIIGGSEVVPHSFPWQVMISSTFAPYGVFCSGSVISANWVLTAAHCVRDESPSGIFLTAGKHNSNTSESTQQRLRACTILFHNYSSYSNDIALVQVRGKFVFNDYVRPICIQPHNETTLDPPPLTRCVATGWGRDTLNDDDATRELRQAVLKLLTKETCDKAYQSIVRTTNPMPDNQLCAGDQPGLSVCHGDSGGPLVCLVEENVWYQVGIVAYGRNCGQLPSFFTRVSSYAQWISETMALNSNDNGTCESICGATKLSGRNGTIFSPNYPYIIPTYTNCRWVITASPDEVVRLIVVEFAWNDLYCSDNYVEIYEGSALQGIRHCSSSTLRPLETTSNELAIVLRTGSYVSYNMFQFDWTTGETLCNQANYTNTTEGTLNSPYYPSSYPVGIKCNWQIFAPENKVIVVEFQDFDLHLTAPCSDDYLVIWDGQESFGARRFCGYQYPSNFAALSSVVTIRFVTTNNDGHNKRGFHLTWHTIDRCASNEYTCWNGSCIPEAMHCDLNNDCLDNSDEIECAHNTSTSSECGKPAIAPQFTWDHRIVGGNEAVPGSWPWQVALSIFPFGFSFCGGSIISDRWILTAAHCVDQSYFNYWVTAGRHKRTGSPGEVSVAVDSVVLHPEYRIYFDGFDIALLRLNTSLSFSDTIRPVCFGTNTTEFSIKHGTICVATGFGDLEYDGDNPPGLYQVRLPIVSNDICGEAYSAILIEIFGSDICAGDLQKGGISVCQGDSGGPLNCYIGNTWYVVGLSSYAVRCADPQRPAVFTRVSWFQNWINGILNVQIADCGNVTVYTSSGGNFTSPGFPYYYPRQQNCTWKIQAPENYLVEVRFVEFRLPSTHRCNEASLEIYDGDLLYTGQQHCGSYSPGNFISSNNAVTFQFDTLNSGSGGFYISWRFEKKCKSDEFGCWDGSQCINITKACDQNRDCPDDSDEIECPQLSTNFTDCGKTSVSPGFTWTERIAGGSRPMNGSWPWHAVILRHNQPVCSGSIIANSFVLTSSSCLFNSNPLYWTVSVGANETTHSVYALITHPDYFNTLHNSLEKDIGLVKVSVPFSFSKTIRPVCLSTNEADLKIGEIGIALGTGALGFNFPNDRLFQVRLPILNTSRCLAELGHNMSTTLFCAGYYEGRQSGTCYGDEGGPMMILVGENTWIQVGVATEATTCQNPGRPSVYTKVSSHSQWIASVLSGNFTVPTIISSVECGTLRYTAASGAVVSPGYPDNYGHNLDCEYTITSPENMVIEVRFVKFDVEDQEECVWDYVEVFDGLEKYTGAKFCGNQLPRNFAAFSNTVRIVFHSDGSVSAQGFLISYTTSVRCNSNQYTCWDGSCIAGEKQCDTVSDCPEGDDEIECVQGTGSNDHCGTVEVPPSFTWDTRIFGGNEANAGSYPWMAMLTDENGNQLCGGTIISDSVILTAAHCILLNADMYVHVGLHHKIEINNGSQSFFVSETIKHENFTTFFGGNDIALLKLSGKINFTSTAKPICIPPSSQGRFEIPPKTRCIATGWGLLGSEVVPDVLHQVRLPIISQTRCNATYPGVLFNSQLCAGNIEKGGVDSCPSDSGGPLFCLVGETSWYQFGIASFGAQCGIVGGLGVYTRVSSFYHWIMNHIIIDLPKPYTRPPPTTTTEPPPTSFRTEHTTEHPSTSLPVYVTKSPTTTTTSMANTSKQLNTLCLLFEMLVFICVRHVLNA